MTVNVKLPLLVLGLAVFWAMPGVGQQPDTPTEQADTLESLKAEITALKVPNVAWREIAWKNCLLDGLQECRTKNKPALLWVFIDRPADDARC